MIRLQENEFGTLAILPDGRVEVLSDEGKRCAEKINRGEAAYSAEQMDAHILYEFDVSPERFHLSAPAIAFLEVTNLCNLACKHCYAHSSPQAKRPNELSLAEIKALLDEWDESGVLQVFLTGGEVFTHPDAVEIIRYARSKRFLTQIFSNGLLITEAHLAQLPAGTAFFVSFDSASAGSTIRGKMTYEKLGTLMRNIEAYGHVCRIAVNVHSRNLDEVPEIFQWCRDNGFPRPQWIDTQPIGRARRNPELIIGADLTDKAAEIFERSLGRFQVEGDRASAPVQEVDTIKFCQRFEAALGVEMSGRMMAYVTSGGDVYPSSNFASESRECAGNLRGRTFADIWESEFQATRATSFADFKDCAECPVAKAGIWCQFRCRVLSENLHGDPNRCGATDHQKAFMLRTHDFGLRLEQGGQRLELI